MLIELHTNYCTRIQGMVLIPGVNNIPKEKEEAFVKDRRFLYFKEHGKLSLILPVEKKGEPEPGPGMEYQAFIKIIKNTLDRELLLRWHEADKRNGVRLVIMKQLEQIMGKKKGKGAVEPEPEPEENAPDGQE